MNPLLWIGALGIALPILAHLLNKNQYKRTDWAAMQFLNRDVKVRSRQIRLRDLFLLILRCLALLLLVAAICKPIANKAGGIFAKLGESRTGVIIAIDASYSMQQSNGTSTRFARAIQKAEAIAAELHPGDPVSLVLLGAEHDVVARNMAFDPLRFADILRQQSAGPEALDLNRVPLHLKALAEDMDAPQKEVYVITDAQETDWTEGHERLRDAFTELGSSAKTVIIPIEGKSENLAITSLDLISGVLRKGTVARYQATVRNYGSSPISDVAVQCRADGVQIDSKRIPLIKPGSSESVSLFIPFHNAGPTRITAEISSDSLTADNVRRVVAVVRERVSILCVDGSSGDAGRLIVAALLARDDGAEDEDYVVRFVPWLSFPTETIEDVDVLVLADVPEITPEQAQLLSSYVRQGNGLIWFAGDQVRASEWNQYAELGPNQLLPATIGPVVDSRDILGAGKPIDPSISDHSVCRPLRSLPEDLLNETRFLKQLQVEPSAASFPLLHLAGSDSPILLEHALGRGHVFMFTTSAEPTWNNMALTPVFPMIMQQIVTYLAGREFEQSRIVGDSLSLSYTKQPDASDAVFDTPSGESLIVPVRERRKQYVALLERAREAGFYEAKVGVQARGMPIAVNVDTDESEVKVLAASELINRFKDSNVMVLPTEDGLATAIAEARSRVSFWRFCIVAVLLLLLIESLIADRMTAKSSAPPADKPRRQTKPPQALAGQTAAASDSWQGSGMPKQESI